MFCIIVSHVLWLVGRIVKYLNTKSISSRLNLLKRLVLDVLKPHKPSVVELSLELSNIEGIEGVNVIMNEIDQQVENVKIIIAGANIRFESIKNKLEEMGATIHSVDEVAAGKRIVENIRTPQDTSARI